MVKVLVIDDDPSFRRMVRLVLEREQHVVIEAQDGTQGVQRFKDRQPDIVISDICMPGKDGVETIREIRALFPVVPIIAMSGGGASIGQQYPDISRNFGANSILFKPFRPAELVTLVNRMLTLTNGQVSD